MKLLKIYFILSCLYAFINSTCGTDEEDAYKYRDYKDCINRTFSTDEIEDGAYKCCYLEIEYKSTNTEREVHGCTPLTQSEFENIRQTERAYEIEAGVDDADIECKSSFIKFGILVFAIILI